MSAGPNASPSFLHGSVRTLAVGTVLSFGGEILRVGVNYIFGIIVARVLGVEDYGVFFLGFTLFNLLSLFSYSAIEDALMRFLGIYARDETMRHARGVIRFGLLSAVAMGILFGLATFFCADTLALKVFRKPELGAVLRCFSPAIPLFALMATAVAGIRGFRVVKPYVLVRKILLPVGGAALGCAALAAGGGTVGLALAYAAAAAVCSLVAVHLLLSFLRKLEGEGGALTEARRFCSFVGSAFVVNLLLFLFMMSDMGIVGIMRPSEDLGVYVAAKKTVQMLTFLLLSLNAIFAPVASHLHSGDEREKLGHAFKTTARWMLTCSLPIFLLMVWFAGELLGLFGPEFVRGRASLIILAAGYMAHVGVGSTGYLLMMTGHQKLMVINSVVIILTATALTVGLVGLYGPAGAAAANAGILALANLVALVQIFVLLRLTPWSRAYAGVLAAGAGMAAALWLSGHYLPAGGVAVTALRAAIGCAVFGGLVLVIGLDGNERRIIGELRRKLSGREKAVKEEVRGT